MQEHKEAEGSLRSELDEQRSVIHTRFVGAELSVRLRALSSTR